MQTGFDKYIKRQRKQTKTIANRFRTLRKLEFLRYLANPDKLELHQIGDR